MYVQKYPKKCIKLKMQNKYIKLISLIIIFIKIAISNAIAEKISEIKIKGNERIADEQF